MIIKTFLLLMGLFVVLFSQTTIAFASTEVTFQKQATPSSYSASLQPVNSVSPAYTDQVVFGLFHTFGCIAVGFSSIGQPCLNYQKAIDQNGLATTIPLLSQFDESGGLIGGISSFLGGLFDSRPIRTSSYIALIGESLGFPKTAHAQVGGSGAAVLNPVLSLWQVSRNLAYIVMIIIFIVIGLMVMFRQRLNPQTILTVQAALPGLVLGLIFITFSYFLASLITDTAFLATSLVGFYFAAAQQLPPGTVLPNLLQQIETQNVLSIFSRFVGMVTQGNAADALDLVFRALSGEVQNVLRVAAGLAAYQYGAAVGPIVGALVTAGACIASGAGIAAVPACALAGSQLGGPAGGFLAGSAAFLNPPWAFGWALWIVAIGVLIYSMLRLLLRLINAYLSIIFLVITAPFHFLIASLPGRQEIATDWIRNMLCNVLAFPAVLGVFYFVAFLLGPQSPGGQLFGLVSATRVTGTAALPLFGGLDTTFINLLLAYGALLATPTIPDIICQAIGKVGRSGEMISQEISAAQRGGQGYTQQGFSNAQRAGSNIGESYNAFRGRPSTWSPASELEKAFGGRELPGWIGPRHREK